MAQPDVDYDGLQSEGVQKIYGMKTPGDVPFSAAKISHVALKVLDLERSVHFYTQVMGFRVSDAYPDTMMPDGMVFLRCSDDHHGVALVGGGTGETTSCEMHHFAFEVSTLDEVFRAREHLRLLGVPLDFEGRRRAGQQIAIEFHDPDGHQIEICWGMDLITPNDDSRPPEQWRAANSLEEAVSDPPVGQDTRLSATTKANA